MADEPRKPKRKYTVTQRVLAASRLNFEKARKAALERRFCATRGTDAEHEAAHAGLEAAQRVKREDNTYKYCSVFRHGLLVANLERSLFMAGESREEYHAHLARFAALPAVFDFDAASQGVKLAQACGFATWRRLRALRLQSEWALRMMVYNLRAAIRLRQTPSPAAEAQAKGEGEASLASFGNTFRNRVISSAAQPGPVISSAVALSGAARNLALKTEAISDFPSPAAPSSDFAQGGPAGQPQSLTPEEFVELAIRLEKAADSWPSLWGPICKLNNRFDQLWCTLVQQLGQPEPFLARLSHTERAAMRLSPIVANLQAYSAEVLGNPLLSRKCMLELLKPRPVYVTPVKEWACSQIPYEVQDRLSAEVRRSRVYLQSLENKQVTLMGNLDYHLLRTARVPQKKPNGQQDASLALELPRNSEEFLALVEAAFGETRDSGSMTQGSTSGTGTPACARPESRNPAPNRATPSTLRDLAQLLWDSAMLPRRRAEEEARLLADYLADYTAKLASSHPKHERRRQAVADRILKLFRQVDDQKRDTISLNRRTRLALYDVAVARYGKQPEFECLIDSNDRSEEIYSRFYKMYWAEVHRILGRESEVRKKSEERDEKQEAKEKKPGGRTKGQEE